MFKEKCNKMSDDFENIDNNFNLILCDKADNQ